MRIKLHRGSQLLMTLVIAALALAPLDVSAGQRRGGGSDGNSGGSSSGGSGGNSGGHKPSGGAERVGSATPRGDGGGSRAGGAPDGGGTRTAAPAGTGTSGGSDSKPGGSSGGDTAHSRPREGQPVIGYAEPRPGGGHGSGGGHGGTVIVPGWYYPWGYGGYGFGAYYGGVYDPWFYDDPYVYGFSDEGALRLKIKPREAQVLVDGYFAGRVDDFDGVFQRLRLESGPHRIEIGADGYETLSFDIRILPDRTVTYEGELRPAPSAPDSPHVQSAALARRPRPLIPQ